MAATAVVIAAWILMVTLAAIGAMALAVHQAGAQTQPTDVTVDYGTRQGPTRAHVWLYPDGPDCTDTAAAGDPLVFTLPNGTGTALENPSVTIDDRLCVAYEAGWTADITNAVFYAVDLDRNCLEVLTEGDAHGAFGECADRPSVRFARLEEPVTPPETTTTTAPTTTTTAPPSTTTTETTTTTTAPDTTTTVGGTLPATGGITGLALGYGLLGAGAALVIGADIVPRLRTARARNITAGLLNEAETDVRHAVGWTTDTPLTGEQILKANELEARFVTLRSQCDEAVRTGADRHRWTELGDACAQLSEDAWRWMFATGPTVFRSEEGGA